LSPGHKGWGGEGKEDRRREKGGGENGKRRGERKGRGQQVRKGETRRKKARRAENIQKMTKDTNNLHPLGGLNGGGGN
jgi:hypothetical protein